MFLKIFIFYSPAIMVYNITHMDFSLGGLLKNFKSAFNPKKSVLGLDIGSSFVKLVQLRKEQERAILETYGEIALGPSGKIKLCEDNNFAFRPEKKHFRRGYRHGSQKAYSGAGFGSGFGLVGYSRE